MSSALVRRCAVVWCGRGTAERVRASCVASVTMWPPAAGSSATSTTASPEHLALLSLQPAATPAATCSHLAAVMLKENLPIMPRPQPQLLWAGALEPLTGMQRLYKEIFALRPAAAPRVVTWIFCSVRPARGPRWSGSGAGGCLCR